MRLRELERVASANQSVVSIPEAGLPSGTVSMSEEEYLLREAARGSISHMSSIASRDSFDSRALPSTLSLEQGAVQRLNDVVAQKERRIVQLEQTARERDEEYSKLQKKYQDLNKRFVDFRSDFFDEKEKLVLRHETEILELKEAQAKQMSTLARQDPSASDIRSTDKLASPNPQGESRGAAALLEQLELLRVENRKLTEKNIADKKIFASESMTKLLAAEKAHNEYISRLKSQIANLDDNNLRMSDQIADLSSKCSALSESNLQLEQARLDALNGQQKLRADLKSMQTAVAASYKLESSQNIGIGVDADTAIKLNEAKNEARVRQLTNQVEFLKSQLSAELASVEELRKVCESAKEKTELLKADFRERISEAERQRQHDVLAAEQRVEQQYELKMNELSSLQAKLSTIQSQMQDAFQDGEAAKQREELAKNMSAKSQAQAAIMRSEIEGLRKQLSDMREKGEVSGGTDNEVNKHSHEAMLRRLDNERQYLKSQLASEITLKNELQSTLAQCQKQLADVQRQWGDDVDALRAAKRSSEEESTLLEQRLTQTISILKADLERNKNQLDDMRSGFIKMREQARSDQSATEEMRAMILRLENDLQTSQSEVNSLKNEEMRAAEMFKNQLAAMTLSIKEVEESKSKMVQSLREELGRQFLENSEVQKQSILLKRDIQDQKFGFNRKVEAIRLYAGLSRWFQNHMGHFFRLWVTNSALVGAAGQFRSKLKQALKRKEEEYEKDREYVSHSVKTDADLRWKEILSAREKELMKQIAEVELKYDKIRDSDNQRNEEELHRQINLMRAEQEESARKLGEEHSSAMEILQQQHNVAISDLKLRARDEINKQIGILHEQAYREKLNAVDEVSKELTSKFEKAITEAEDSHFDKIRSIEQSHTNALNLQKAVLEGDFSKQVKILTADWFEKENSLKRSHGMELANLEARMLDERNLAISNCQSETERLLSEARQDAHIASEERLRLMRQLWEEELVGKLKAKDGEVEALVAKRVEEAAFASSEFKQKAVKMEAAKWQQMLKEAEKRYVLEVQQAKAKGYADCEKKLQEEMKIEADNNARKLVVAADGYKMKIEELRRDQEEAVEHMKTAHEVKLDQLARDVEERVRLRMEADMMGRIANTVESAKEEVRAHYQEKLAKEESRFEKLRADMSRMTLAQADDRRKLESQIDAYEIRMQQKDISCKEVVAKLELEMQRVKDQSSAFNNKMRKELTEDFEELQQELLSKAKSEWEDDTRRRIEKEKDLIMRQVDLQMAELQQENDKLISGLEVALTDLRKEKIALSNELEATTTKLENAEDSLYDSQQDLLKLQKSNSFSLWKLGARCKLMSHVFKKEIEQLRRDQSEELQRANSEAKVKMEDFVMLVLKLSNLMVQSEGARARIYATLTTFKSDMLIEKRTGIKLLEKEISRLSDEKEVLEERRDSGEAEVKELEEQVRELEEQIREHNRSSSVMQNGRINVAHARKKKRIDTELERILDLIEQKRSQINDLDDRIDRLSTQKDEKESDMVDMEKGLVGILIEQQKHLLTQVEEAKLFEEKGKMLVKMSTFPWPPPENPTHHDIETVLKAKKMEP
jgi:hypothetical protein